MNEKTFHVVTRYRIYTVLSWFGVAVAIVGYFLTGVLHNILPWVGLVLVLGAVVYRFTMIRCPHCGHLLTESKSIPAKCPKCEEALK